MPVATQPMPAGVLSKKSRATGSVVQIHANTTMGNHVSTLVDNCACADCTSRSSARPCCSRNIYALCSRAGATPEPPTLAIANVRLAKRISGVQVGSAHSISASLRLMPRIRRRAMGSLQDSMTGCRSLHCTKDAPSENPERTSRATASRKSVMESGGGAVEPTLAIATGR